jgi:hypothetical protein
MKGSNAVSTEIAAPPELVFRLAHDPLRWPALLPHYLRANELGRERDGSVLASYVARRELVPIIGLGIPVAWRSRSSANATTCRLQFHHLGGATDGMDVTWRIEPTRHGCRVTIEHVFRPRVPVWAFVVDRIFVRPIATRTLSTFKVLAEAIAADGESEVVHATNITA